ncbi:hypothetical protein HDK77DRAFT_440248 [Phyllosticta capitalensis]
MPTCLASPCLGLSLPACLPSIHSCHPPIHLFVSHKNPSLASIASIASHPININPLDQPASWQARTSPARRSECSPPALPSPPLPLIRKRKGMTSGADTQPLAQSRAKQRQGHAGSQQQPESSLTTNRQAIAIQKSPNNPHKNSVPMIVVVCG